MPKKRQDGFVAVLELDTRELLMDAIRTHDSTLSSLLGAIVTELSSLPLARLEATPADPAIGKAFERIEAVRRELMTTGLTEALATANHQTASQMVKAFGLPDTIQLGFRLGGPNAEAAALFDQERVITLHSGSSELFSLSRNIHSFTETAKARMITELRQVIYDGISAADAAKALAATGTINPFTNSYIREIEQRLGFLSGALDPDTITGLRKTLQEYQTYAQGYKSEEMIRAANDLDRQIREAVTGEGVRSAIDRWVYQKTLYHSKMVARTELSRAFTEKIRSQVRPWVLGFRVSLSPAHPRPDMCDDLARDYLFSDGYDKDMQLPPWHPNCCTGDTLIYAPGLIAALRIPYKGPVLKVRVSQGSEITVSVNHHFLTERGFVRADQLGVGDKIVQYLGGKRGAANGPYNYGEPTRIAEIFETFSKTSGMELCRVPVSTEDFYGDGGFVQGYVDVVAPTGLLSCEGEPSIGEDVAHKGFDGAESTATGFEGLSSFASMLLTLANATDSIVGERSTAHTLLRGNAGVLLGHDFRLGTEFNTVVLEDSGDAGSGSAQALRHWLDVFSGQIGLDEVVSVEWDRSFLHGGFLYDVQTLPTLYISNGMVSSNCICITTLLMDKDYIQNLNNQLRDQTPPDKYTAEVLGDVSTKGEVARYLSERTGLAKSQFKNQPKDTLVSYISRSDDEIIKAVKAS